MQRFLRLAMALALFLSAARSSQAGDREAAIKIINLAIESQGGAERLARAQIMSRTAKGTMILLDKEIPFTTKLVIAFPDKFHDVIDVDLDNQKNQVIRVINGDKGWQVSGAVNAELSKPELEELQDETYVIWLTTLAPLKDSAFDLDILPDASVRDHPASAVKVTRQGKQELKMYFDKKSGQLVKIERPARIAGITVQKQYEYGDPKAFDGLRVPTKYTEFINGKKTTELTVTSCDFPAKVDEKLFSPP